MKTNVVGKRTLLFINLTTEINELVVEIPLATINVRFGHSDDLNVIQADHAMEVN